MDGSEDVKACFDRHAAALVLYARQWLDDRADAEDAVQETFVRVWVNRQHGIGSLASLYASVRSRAMDFRRSRRRRTGREQRVAGMRPEPIFDPTIGRDETRTAIELALKDLPAEQAEIVVLKVWGGLTFADMAQVIGISLNTAASRYRYGIETLRKALSQEVEP